MWILIDFAPLDGSLVDLWVEAQDARFRATGFRWNGSAWVEKVSGNTLDQAFSNVGMRVTHWMWTPSPPLVSE